MADFEVRKDDLRTTRFADAGAGDGPVRLRIDRFGLTANNVTYGLLGEMLRYWAFFPPSEDGWGRVPVWGYADVVESAVEGIEPGERYYGYFPMSPEIAVHATPQGPGFAVADEHRADLPPVYNQYLRVEPDMPYADEQLILRPLFATAVVLEDFLRRSDWFGADAIVLGSASSKTAYGLAFLLARRDDTPDVVGLTSERNRGFVESLGIYDRVLTYDAVDLPGGDVAYVDMSGDPSAHAAVHAAAGERLKRSIAVGATHWEQTRATGADVPEPEFFFAPTEIERMTTEHGPGALPKRVGEAWAELAPRLTDWLRIERLEGEQALETAWRRLVDGEADPRTAQVVSL